MALLTGIQSQRSMTIIVVTHEAEVARMGHRNVRLLDGRVVAVCESWRRFFSVWRSGHGVKRP